MNAPFRLLPRLNANGSVIAPTTIPNLWAWYDAADLTTLFTDNAGSIPVAANNDPVGRWADKSGNGRHANQTGAATTRPTYTTNVQNGRAGILYDGGDYLDTTATPNSFPLTIVGVGRTSATVGTNRGVVANRNSTTPSGSRVWFSTTNALNAQIDTPLKTVVSASSIGANTTYLFGGRFGNTQISALLNAALLDDTHSASAVANIVSLGRLNTNATSSLWTGHLLEVVIYAGALTTAQLYQVRTYLNSKWGVF